MTAEIGAVSCGVYVTKTMRSWLRYYRRRSFKTSTCRARSTSRSRSLGCARWPSSTARGRSSSTATRIYLIRHAATTLEPGRCCGSLNVGLSDEGREQARLLAETFGRVELAAVYTSPLDRARHTAAEVATRHELAPSELPGLAEIDFGELESRRFEEIAATHADVYATWMSRPTEVEFPDGESFTDFSRRVRETVRDVRLTREREPIAIVSHGGPIRIVAADALAMPQRALFRLDQSFAGLSVIDWIEGSPIVRLLNAATT